MKRLILTAACACIAAPALAEWSLDGAGSTLGFVSIKNGDTAEAHNFGDLSGSVSDAGEARVEIPLSSVETFIDIRNERMRDILFNIADFPAATVSAQIDMAAFEDMEVAARSLHEIEVTVAANGQEARYPADVAVTRIGEGAVAVATTRPLIADARDLGYEGGLSELQEIAGLDAISPAVPVTFDLIFTR